MIEQKKQMNQNKFILVLMITYNLYDKYEKG